MNNAYVEVTGRTAICASCKRQIRGDEPRLIIKKVMGAATVGVRICRDCVIKFTKECYAG